jgi:hypothetical protein
MNKQSDVGSNYKCIKDDASMTEKQQSFLLTLNNQLDQFQRTTRTRSGSTNTSQRERQTLRRLTTIILTSIQDLILIPPHSICSKDGESCFDVADDVKAALTVLLNDWGTGDVQVYTALVEALIRSYSVEPSLCPHEKQWSDSVQNFILLDLLPYVTHGDSENCYHAQSVIAQALIQILSSSTDNFSSYSPIIDWCRWHLDYMYYQQQYPLHDSFTVTKSIRLNYVLSPEIYELGVTLLRKVNSPYLLPTTLRIVLGHFNVMITSNTEHNTLLLQHATKVVETLRQRLGDFMLFRQQYISADDSLGKSLKEIDRTDSRNHLTWQLHLAHVIVEAVTNESGIQGDWWTTAYLQQLMLIVDRKAPQSRSTFLVKDKRSDIEDPCVTTYININDGCHHSSFVALDWIFVIALLPLSSSRHHRSLFTIIHALSRSKEDTEEICSLPTFHSLSTLIDIVLLKDYTASADNYSPSFVETSEISVNILDTIQYVHTQEQLVPGLLQLAVVLLLNPERISSSWSIEGNNAFYNKPSLSSLDRDKQDSTPLTRTPPQSWVHDFVLYLHGRLDCHRQEELVNILLHLVDEITRGLDCCTHMDSFTDFFVINETNSNYRERGVRSCKRTISDPPWQNVYVTSTLNSERTGGPYIVLQSVYASLNCLAKKAPECLIRCKDELIKRLLMTSLEGAAPPYEPIVRPICSILVSLLISPTNTVKNDFSDVKSTGSFTLAEVLLLLQKLLFGEPIRGDTSRVIRGILLATELLSTQGDIVLTLDNRKCIQEWVLRILLPSTRRMVDPELGIPGLLFLQAWIAWNENNNCHDVNFLVFQHFKMIIANTGLIQMIDRFQGGAANERFLSANPTSLFAYSSPEAPSELVEHNDKRGPFTRNLVFGVHFFLRHSGDVALCPFRWAHVTNWIYALVDTYLHMGRNKASKNWCPNNWLLASLEFPVINTSLFKRSIEAQNSVVEWIYEKVSHFDISEGSQQEHCFPAAYADTIVRCLFSKKMRQFLDSVKCLSLALLLGISLSAAVLKNAFEHVRTLETDTRDLKVLLKLQMTKIYDLRAKSTTIDSLFSAVGSALRRSLLRKKRATVVLSDDSSDGSSGVVPASSVRTIQVRHLIVIVHVSIHFLSHTAKISC